MDLMGIGVLLIGIALLVLAIYLARVLNNVASILMVLIRQLNNYQLNWTASYRRQGT